MVGFVFVLALLLAETCWHRLKSSGGRRGGGSTYQLDEPERLEEDTVSSNICARPSSALGARSWAPYRQGYSFVGAY